MKMREKAEAMAAVERYGQLAQEFRDESDRGCAVLVLCVLEDLLHDLIKRRVVDSSGSIRQLAPPGRLSAAIESAVQLGLLNERQAKSFAGLAKVRNKFAHGVLAGLSFETPEVASLVRSIEPGTRYPKDRDFDADIGDPSARSRFLMLASVLVIWMVLVEPDRLEAAGDPDPDAMPWKDLPPVG